MHGCMMAHIPDLGVTAELEGTPVHGGICEGGAGHNLMLGLVVALSSLAGCNIVCLVGAGGCEGQAGPQGPGLVCQRHLHNDKT